MSTRHLVFVDDDPTEIKTFERLYKRDPFSVTCVHADEARHAFSRVKENLKGSRPSLFVLDMFFPHESAPPQSFASFNQEELLLQPLSRIIDNATNLKRAAAENPQQAKTLLRDLHSVLHLTGLTLRTWCDRLGQSPKGGILLLKDLDNAYPGVPKIFYSRKATLADAKDAIAAGAIDVLSKPDSTDKNEERRQADAISLAFEQYCDGKAPSFLQKLAKHFGVEIGYSTTQGVYAKAYKKKQPE